MRIFLAIDPGLKNTCASLVKVQPWTEHGVTQTQAVVLWSRTFDLSGRVNPDREKASQMAWDMHSALNELHANEGQGVDEILVEFQPPINIKTNPALCRWNSWIEGYLVAEFRNYHVEYVHPNGLKRWFDITGGSHSVNKSLAIMKARTFFRTQEEQRKMTNHEADCVLMAVYRFEKTKE